MIPLLQRFSALAGVAVLAGGVALAEAGGAVETPAAPGATPSADTLRVIPGETVMGVVVQTTGFASRFAPDHFIHLPDPDLTLVLDPQRPQEACFSGEFWVPDLVADDPELRSRLDVRLQELGLLDDDYDDMSDDDRADVRAAMLSEGQLNAAEYSTIRIESVEVGEGDGDPFPWAGTVALTVRGVTVEAPFQADLQEEGDRIRIEAFARFLTSDFGIEPYRAFMGAVRNSDEIALYLDLAAERR